MEANVKIGPEFFANAIRDYNDFAWSWVREVLQNAFDSGATEVRVKTECHTGCVAVEDNGAGMSAETITDKLLTLGGSGKRFTNGSVGGFGKAKELLFFSQNAYSIYSRDNYVEGIGGSYNLTKRPTIQGTIVAVNLRSTTPDVVANKVAAFATLCNWKGSLFLNGVKIATNTAAGRLRTRLSFGRVYTNNLFNGYVIIRMNGLPMFIRKSQYDKCVIVELDGNSSQVLTSSRDGLLYIYQMALDEFVESLLTNKRKAFAAPAPEITYYDGAQLKANLQPKATPVQQVEELPVFVDESEPTGDEQIADSVVKSQEWRAVIKQDLFLKGSNSVEKTVIAAYARNRALSALRHDFLIYNTTGMKVPEHYVPTSAKFGKYAKKLASIWADIMLRIHVLDDNAHPFKIGFCFDEEAEALYSNDGQYGQIYYLNPVSIVKQASGSRSLKNRYVSFNLYNILAVAVHEYVHGLGYSNHDEAYASMLTDKFALVMKHSRDITKGLGK